MNKRFLIRTVVPAAAAVAAALPLGAVVASASAPAPSSVTIKAEGTELLGTVSSGRTACEGNRTVFLFKVIGTRGGGDDSRYAVDTTEVVNGVGVWSTGNTGTAGRFYARVTKTATCQAAVSPTVRAVRN